MLGQPAELHGQEPWYSVTSLFVVAPLADMLDYKSGCLPHVDIFRNIVHKARHTHALTGLRMDELRSCPPQLSKRVQLAQVQRST